MADQPTETAPVVPEEPEKAPPPEPAPRSMDPPKPAPSTSALSSAPATDTVESSVLSDALPKSPADDHEDAASQPFQQPQLSAQTESVLKRINDNAASAAASGTPGWEAAREQVMKDMQTSDKILTPPPPNETAPAQESATTAVESSTTVPATKMEVDTTQATPASASSRGRGGGRPRGRARGGRGSKRKRERSDDESENSEVYTPVVTTTKSGRSVQKPTSFVPAPASPTSSNKRKRPYRKNPESAVCKICLRGTSPANNMIVFCDGCNSPYHRYCHHPPIDQAVVDEVDREWYCKQCERERVAPVPESEVVNFISAEGAPVEQRQRYFASLSPGMLVTLLTRATTLKPDLPVFAPDFRARIGSMSAVVPGATMPHSSNGHAHPEMRQQQLPTSQMPTGGYSGQYPPSQTSGGAPHARQHRPQQFMQSYPNPAYGPDVHPPHYPQPGHGMMRSLPPEQQDLQWLVDDNDRYSVYNHMYNAQPPMQNPGMNGGLGRPAQ